MAIADDSAPSLELLNTIPQDLYQIVHHIIISSAGICSILNCKKKTTRAIPCIRKINSCVLEFFKRRKYHINLTMGIFLTIPPLILICFIQTYQTNYYKISVV